MVAQASNVFNSTPEIKLIKPKKIVTIAIKWVRTSIPNPPQFRGRTSRHLVTPLRSAKGQKKPREHLTSQMRDPVLRLGPRTSIQPLGLNGQGPGTRAQAPLTNHHYPHETSIKVMSRIIGRQCKVLPGLT